MTTSQALAITDEYAKIRHADRSTYRSLPLMTKYEFDQVIGLRTMHLSKGAPPLIDMEEGFKVTTNMQLRDVAQKELLEGKLPYMIKRVMPNGKPEYWSVGDLDLTAIKHLVR
jgi:DNA-directed RNA polymerase I, II, and III subunit RPABC2